MLAIQHFFVRESGVQGYNVADHLPGPTTEIGAGLRYPSKKEIIAEMATAGVTGKAHLKWSELQDRYQSCPSLFRVIWFI